MMIENKAPMIFLAPMAGVTDGICRRFCFEQGCDYATTEMISAQGYMTAPKDSHAYAYMLKVFPGEGRVFCQLFGREPEWFVRAVEKLQDQGTFCGFDKVPDASKFTSVLPFTSEASPPPNTPPD